MILTATCFIVFVALQPGIFCDDRGITSSPNNEFINEFRELKKIVQAQQKELDVLKNRIDYLENQQGFKAGNHYAQNTDPGTHGSRVSRLLVENEVGNVAFCAYLDHRNFNLGPDQPLVFNRVLLNEGNAYNNLTGMFTAPISGLYIFSFAVTCTRFTGEPAEEIRVKLVVNNTHQLTAIAQSNIEYDDNQGGNTAILHVNKGDVVWIGHHSNIGDNLFSNDDLRVTSFTGALLTVD